MIIDYLYKGFLINEVDDGYFDISNINGEIVDGDVHGFDNARRIIDSDLFVE